MSWRFSYDIRGNRMITVKVYLKSRRTPIVITFEKQSQYDDYMTKLLNSDVIVVGCFAFAKSEFRYQVVNF